MILRLLLVAEVFFFAALCMQNPTAPLAGTEWRVTDIGGKAPETGIASTISFNEGGRVSGRAGCNRFFGSVALDGAAMKFGAIGSTRMACPGPAMQQESLFLAALAKAERYEMQGAELLIYAQGFTKPLRFAREGAAAAKPLVIVLIGPPASGKSTQAEFLVKRYNMALIARDTLARQAGARLDAALKEKIVSLNGQGFILDGYPSTREEADHLAQLVKEMKLPNPLVIQLNVPDGVARERALQAGGAVKARFEIDLNQYKRELALARTYYPESDIWTVDGNRAPTEVSETIRLLIADRQ